MADTSRPPPPHVGYSPVKRGRMHGGYSGTPDVHGPPPYSNQSGVLGNKDDNDMHQYSKNLPKGEWSVLDIQERGLSRLSPRLESYKFLTGLFLAKNKFEEIPKVLFELRRNLLQLDLSDNQITVVPTEIGQLVRLKVLNMSNNMVRTLPVEAGRLWRLDKFGITGNPLDEHHAGLLHKEGPLPMLKALLERTNVPSEVIQRPWFTNVEGAKLGQKKGATGEGFTVFCYNILCDRYCTKELYGYSPSWSLDWDYRKKKILEEILQYEGDVVCLQEVELGQFKCYFQVELAKHGWEGRCKPKSRARTMSEEGQSHVDGCAVFWKKDKFKLAQEHFIEFSRLASAVAQNLPKGSQNGEDFINRVQIKDNICLACLLESKQTGLNYLVANAHIHWDPEFCDVKVIQSCLMLIELKAIMRSLAVKPALILCGDFNSMPDSGVYQYLAQGQIPPDHVDIAGRHYGNFLAQGLRHPFNLRSCYASWGDKPFTKELLPFTNYTVDFTGVIDYIWYDADTLCVTKLCDANSPKIISKSGYAPNPHFPSDHFALVVEIRRKA